MEIEEAIDILENIIDDEVIGIYCMEIQKRGVNCAENCKDRNCYLSEAISTIINHADKLQKENEELKKELDTCNELEIAQDIGINKLQADKNKLINYIAIRENKDFEQVCKEFNI